MSNQMIVEFAHRRIRELKLEIRDMQLIIEEFNVSDNIEVSVADMNGMCVMNEMNTPNTVNMAVSIP
jgi:hypothetical protein